MHCQYHQSHTTVARFCWLLVLVPPLHGLRSIGQALNPINDYNAAILDSVLLMYLVSEFYYMCVSGFFQFHLSLHCKAVDKDVVPPRHARDVKD